MDVVVKSRFWNRIKSATTINLGSKIALKDSILPQIYRTFDEETNLLTFEVRENKVA